MPWCRVKTTTQFLLPEHSCILLTVITPTTGLRPIQSARAQALRGTKILNGEITFSRRILAQSGPLEQRYLRIGTDVQLASIFAENILEGFASHLVGASSVSGIVEAWRVPQPWDIPTLGINFQLMESGFSRLARACCEMVSPAGYR